jgi:tight adherence protein C
MTTLLILMFVVVMAAVTMAGMWWSSRSAAAVETPGTPALGNATVAAINEAESQGMMTALQWVGERAPASAGRRGDPLRKLLNHAGYRALSAPSIFQGIKWVLVVVLGCSGFFGGLVSGGQVLLGTIALAGIGFILPDQVLKGIGSRRKAKLRRGLPATMDLLVLSIEAGQSLDMALMETARGIKASHPEIATDLNMLTGDLRANTSRADALRMFFERTGEPEIKKLASLLNDTDRFGTSLGPALRNHAKYLRTRVRQHAQEAARKVGVKLIFPVFFLIFPSVILVTLGPAVIMVSQQMAKYMAQ